MFWVIRRTIRIRVLWYLLYEINKIRLIHVFHLWWAFKVLHKINRICFRLSCCCYCGQINGFLIRIKLILIWVYVLHIKTETKGVFMCVRVCVRSLGRSLLYPFITDTRICLLVCNIFYGVVVVVVVSIFHFLLLNNIASRSKC